MRIRLLFIFIFIFLLLSTLVQTVIAQDSQLFLYATSESYYSDVAVYLYNMDDRSFTHIADIASISPNAGFSLDGDYVYLLSNGDNENRIAELYNLETRERILLSDQLWTEACEVPLYWSPDNRSLLYITQPDDDLIQHSLYDLQTGMTLTLPEKLPLWEIYDPQWSPDGRFLIQYMPSLPYESEAYVWDVTTRDIIATFNVNQLYSKRWSPDSRYFAFISDERTAEMSIFDSETLTTETYEGSDIGAWSPDSRYLSYQYGTTRMLVDIEGNTTHAIYENLYQSYYLHNWSYDSQILVLAINNGDEQGVLLFEPATGNSRKLNRIANYVSSLSWSPTEHYVAIIQEDGGDDPNLINLIVHDLDDDTVIAEHDVTIPIIYGDVTLRWSPSGEYFTVWQEDGIYLLSLDDGELSHMNPSIPLTSSPRWSSDGQFLAYDTANDVYVLNLKTGETLTLDEEQIARFIGWQGANQNNTLVECGASHGG